MNKKNFPVNVLHQGTHICGFYIICGDFLRLYVNTTSFSSQSCEWLRILFDYVFVHNILLLHSSIDFVRFVLHVCIWFDNMFFKSIFIVRALLQISHDLLCMVLIMYTICTSKPLLPMCLLGNRHSFIFMFTSFHCS